jgi:hypothetical protein
MGRRRPRLTEAHRSFGHASGTCIGAGSAVLGYSHRLGELLHSEARRRSPILPPREVEPPSARIDRTV